MRFKLDFQPHAVGDFSLVITEYVEGNDGIILSGPFANPAEIEEEFSKIERAIAQAKKRHSNWFLKNKRLRWLLYLGRNRGRRLFPPP